MAKLFLEMNKKIFENIECASPHKCPKEKHPDGKCAYCELGYNLIACEPKSLQCGHYACNECTEKIKNRDIKCRICSNEMVNTNAPASASDCLIELMLKQLTEQLREKYKIALKNFSGNKLA